MSAAAYEYAYNRAAVLAELAARFPAAATDEQRRVLLAAWSLVGVAKDGPALDGVACAASLVLAEYDEPGCSGLRSLVGWSADFAGHEFWPEYPAAYRAAAGAALMGAHAVIYAE